MFALSISIPLFKTIILYQNSPTIKLFLQKHAKFSSAGVSTPRPQLPVTRQLGALPPDPQHMAAGALPQAPNGLQTVGGYAPRSQNIPHIANFWLCAWRKQRIHCIINTFF